jgi:uncharacterized membrane protein
MMSLLGVLVLLAGLVTRRNPLLVVTAAALVAGLAGGVGLLRLLADFGKAFNDARYISIAFLILPVIGVLERSGLQVEARAMVARLRALTVGRLLLAYLALRQLTAALGMLSLGGQATMVRPLIAPMAEGIDAAGPGPGLGEVDASRRAALIRAHAAAVDNIGAFFGEDIFVALGSVLLIQAVLQQNHIAVAPLRVALWAIPTALVAFAAHAARLMWLDRRLQRQAMRR